MILSLAGELRYQHQRYFWQNLMIFIAQSVVSVLYTLPSTGGRVDISEDAHDQEWTLPRMGRVLLPTTCVMKMAE